MGGGVWACIGTLLEACFERFKPQTPQTQPDNPNPKPEPDPQKGQRGEQHGRGEPQPLVELRGGGAHDDARGQQVWARPRPPTGRPAGRLGSLCRGAVALRWFALHLLCCRSVFGAALLSCVNRSAAFKPTANSLPPAPRRHSPLPSPRLRQRQMRNMVCSLMLSHGVPMIQMGDEYGHSKVGPGRRPLRVCRSCERAKCCGLFGAVFGRRARAQCASAGQRQHAFPSRPPARPQEKPPLQKQPRRPPFRRRPPRSPATTTPTATTTTSIGWTGSRLVVFRWLFRNKFPHDKFPPVCGCVTPCGNVPLCGCLCLGGGAAGRQAVPSAIRIRLALRRISWRRTAIRPCVPQLLPTASNGGAPPFAAPPAGRPARPARPGRPPSHRRQTPSPTPPH